MRDKLIQLITKLLQPNETVSVEEIADYLLAEGVIVPPVKVGQTVYYPIHHLNKVEELEVCEISYRRGKIYIYARYIIFTANDINKLFFLTREEAEEALERSENGT